MSLFFKDKRHDAKKRTANPKSTFFYSFLGKNKFLLIAIILLNALGGWTRTLGASYIQRIIDSFYKLTTEPFSWTLVCVGALIMESSYILRYISAVASRYMSAKSAAKLRVAMMKKLQVIPFLEFEKFQVGDIFSILRNEADDASEVFYNVFSRIFNNFFLFLFSVLYLLSINWRLTLVLVGFMLLLTYINQHILNKLKTYYSAAKKSLGRLNNQTDAFFTGIDVIKTFGAKDYALGVFDLERESYNKQRFRAAAVDTARLSFYTLSHNLSLFVAVLFLGYQALEGTLTIGEAVAYLYVIKQILIPIEVIFRWMGRLVRSRISWARTQEILGLPIENEVSKEYPERTEAIQQVEVKNLSFSYGSTPIFNNLGFSLKQNAPFVLAGESGSGKTTLLKILLGLYDAKETEYLLNGDEKVHSLYGRCAFASSDKHIFALTLYENLTLGNQEISREDCIKSIHAVGLDDWFHGLENGLDTLIDSDKLSGGQKQSISNARCLLSNRPILILDEPYSALDPDKENLLTDNIQHLQKDKIIILTSHRKDSLSFCNEGLYLS